MKMTSQELKTLSSATVLLIWYMACRVSHALLEGLTMNQPVPGKADSLCRKESVGYN
jgi:hypothetical protein